MNPIDEIVGQNLREKRVMRGLSQDQLGESVGVSFQQIQKYERGTNRISASRLVELAAAMEVQLEDLFEGVTGELKKFDSRRITVIKRENKVLEEYGQLPEEMQVAVGNLVKAMFVNLGKHFKGGAQ